MISAELRAEMDSMLGVLSLCADNPVLVLLPFFKKNCYERDRLIFDTLLW